MNKKFIKGFLFLSMALSLSSLDASSFFSDKNDTERMLRQRQRNQQARKEKGTTREEKVSGDWGVKMPAAHGCSSNEGFVVSVDYMIMRSYQPNLVYAFEKKVIPDAEALGLGIMQGNMIHPTRTWRPGFRLGLGWNTPYDLWDVQSNWTYYYNKSVTNKKANPPLLANNTSPNNGFFPYWVTPMDNNAGVGPAIITNISTYNQMQGVWQLNYNMINLELGRSLYLTKALALRPHMGLQNGWIHQKSDIRYGQSRQAASENNGPDAQRVQLTNKFWGIGLRTGMSGKWQLGYGFSLLGKVAGSILSGRVNARKTQDTSENGVGGRDMNEVNWLRVYNSYNKTYQLSPNLESSLGLMWSTCLNQDDMYFGVSLNWESIYWWGQFRYIKPPQGPLGSGDYRLNYDDYPFSDDALNIEGVTVKARFDF